MNLRAKVAVRFLRNPYSAASPAFPSFARVFMPYVLIIHEVADYPAWKKIFDRAADLRWRAGERSYQVLKYDTDANKIVHFSVWTSLDDARRFFESPQLVQIRIEAGVKAPEFIYLEQLEAGVLSAPPGAAGDAFDRSETALPQAVVAQLLTRGQTLGTAESLTGGGIGAALTSVPGSSAAYVGGFVTYTDAMKTACLGVPESLLQTHGAVSELVALAMAQGALEKTGAHYALATTGIAGPGGGDAETPVGTVWIALATRGESACAQRFAFPGGREDVRQRATWAALQMLRQAWVR